MFNYSNRYQQIHIMSTWTKNSLLRQNHGLHNYTRNDSRFWRIFEHSIASNFHIITKISIVPSWYWEEDWSIFLVCCICRTMQTATNISIQGILLQPLKLLGAGAEQSRITSWTHAIPLQWLYLCYCSHCDYQQSWIW